MTYELTEQQSRCLQGDHKGDGGRVTVYQIGEELTVEYTTEIIGGVSSYTKDVYRCEHCRCLFTYDGR